MSINLNIIIKRFFPAFLISAIMLFAGIMLVSANPDVTITTATGGESISIDTTATGGTGAWVSLTGPVIQEGAAGEIAIGSHVLSLPAGWEFNTSQNVTIAVGGGSELALSSNIIVPGTTTLSFNVSVISSSGPGSLSFSGIQVRPTGTTTATGYITQSSGVITGVTNDTTSFGTLTTVPGVVTQVAITTEPTNTVYGSTISPVVVNTKDQFGNNSVSGLGSSETITMTIASGTGTLSGTLTQDIGTGSGNGTATFNAFDILISSLGSFTLQMQSTSYGNDISASFDITAKPVTATITASNKVYDKNTTATITGATPVGTVGDDDLTVVYSSATATFASATVADGIVVNATGLTLGGDDASLYSFATGAASTTANITQKSLTLGGSFTANNKTYDRTTAATINADNITLLGIESGDEVTLTKVLVFDSKDVANGITVSLTGSSIAGAAVANYSLSLEGAPTTTANITAKPLTLDGSFTANNKVYDKTTDATINANSITLTGVESGDSVILTPVLAFATVAKADGVAVSLTASSSIDNGNYSLSLTGAPTTTANITAKELTVSGAAVTTKVYDRNTDAVITGATLAGVIEGDTVTLGAETAGTFNDKTVASSKSVITSMTISGDSATNYTITQPTLTGEITAKELTVSGITASSKVYDETTSATLNTGSASFVGIIGGDIVNLITTGASGVFSSASIGSGKTVTISGITKDGTDALNYTITQPTTTADITAGALHHFNVVVPTTPVMGTPANITITAVDQYDNTISAANLVTPFTGQVFIETDASNATYNSNTSFIAGNEGTKTLTGGITFNSAESSRSVSVYNLGATVLGTTGAIINVSASDTTAPAISSVSLNKGTYRLTQDANITVTVVEDDTASTVLISGTNGEESPAGTWTRTFAHGKSAIGTYSFNVVATDASGNQSVITVFYNVVADDAAAPTTVTINSPTAGATVSGSVTLTSTNGEYYQIDGGSWIAIATAWDTTAVVNGSHTVKVKGGDPIGYSETIVVIVNNTSDTTAPAISSISLNKGTYRLTQDANITVTVVEDDTASTVLISGTNGTEDPAGTWTRTFAHGKSAVGAYSFNVVATDANSNQSIVTVFYNVVADDAAAPVTVSIDTPTAGSTVSGSVTLTSTNGEYYQVDGGSWVAIATAWDTTAVVNGSHTVKVKGGDPIGYSETIVVIVDNTPAQGDGSLEVTRISTTKSYGTADGTYPNGWAWVFDITVPTSEELLSMKFSNWISGEDTIATANNMRIYSAESLNASDADSAITITSAGTYSSNLTLNADLNSSLEGRQVRIIVEMKIPEGSSGASYQASYGVNSASGD
ncbi:MAG: YDG domain-containing protein [Dysgonamonadaceae bacterium]|nr:YDG domain-containing protein [Dysgonamonadaceae bacterium]MDD4400063.1 YDG domain-containing protein [Dysgonamonadaceae bacterium]